MTTRREFFKTSLLAGAGMAILNNTFASERKAIVNTATEFTLPPLPYAYDALEPYIDKLTMQIHHDKHHQGYVNKLNKALAELKISGVSLEDLCKNASKYPAAVRNNAGGHYNHSLFWKIMKPASASVLSPGDKNEPKGKLGDAMNSNFGSFENFKTSFSKKAGSVFGSGWAWLITDKNHKLEIVSTPNQNNPLMDIAEFKGIPLMGVDVWEHAYYLKYQNKRSEYVNAWWNVVNWDEVSLHFEGK